MRSLKILWPVTCSLRRTFFLYAMDSWITKRKAWLWGISTYRLAWLFAFGILGCAFGQGRLYGYILLPIGTKLWFITLLACVLTPSSEGRRWLPLAWATMFVLFQEFLYFLIANLLPGRHG